MTEIKGFDVAYRRMQGMEKVKQLNRRARADRIKTLVDQGIDKELAEVMVDTGCVQLFQGRSLK